MGPPSKQFEGGFFIAQIKRMGSKMEKIKSIINRFHIRFFRKTTLSLFYVFIFLKIYSCGCGSGTTDPTGGISVLDAPIITNQKAIVFESIDEEEVIYQVNASDPEGQLLTYHIATNDDDLFEINSNGVLSLRRGRYLDYEMKSEHRLVVEAFNGRSSSEAIIDIEVKNIDEPPIITNQEFLIEITNEGAIGPVIAFDPENESLIYSIFAYSYDLFKIDHTNGEITLKSGKILAFNPVTPILIDVFDGQTSSRGTVIIRTHSNHSPMVDDQSFLVSESIRENEIIGVVEATDESGLPLTYSLLINDNDLFELSDTNGEIRLAFGKSLDYDVASEHSLVVEVSDGGLSSSMATITIHIQDNQPPIVEDTVFTTIKSSYDRVIGTVVASDPEGYPVYYSLLNNGESSNGFPRLEIGSESGLIKLAQGEFFDDVNYRGENTNVFDLSVSTQHTVIVEVSDGYLSSTATVTINVEEDRPPISEDQRFTVIEDIYDDEIIGYVVVGDDSFEQSAYSTGTHFLYLEINDGMLSAKNDFFEIDTQSGNAITLVDGVSLDYETTNQHVFSVGVVEAFFGGREFFTTVIIDVVTNQYPIITNHLFTVSDNIRDTFVIGQVHAIDPEGRVLNYTVNKDESLFEIDFSTGDLSLAEGQSLDFDRASNHNLMITVIDRYISNTTTVTINVFSNQAPVIEDQTFMVIENIKDDEIIDIVLASDPEADDLTYTLLRDDAHLFEINADNGEISLSEGKRLDYEMTKSHSFVVQVSDGDFSVTATMTVVVLNTLDINNVTNVARDGTLPFDRITSVNTAEIAGTTYLFVTAEDRQYGGLSVFSVNGDGFLSNVTNILSLDSDFSGLYSTSLVKVGEVFYLFVAGFINSQVSMFSIGYHGFNHITNVVDDANLKLQLTKSLSTLKVDDKTYLFVAGQLDDGVSVFLIGNDGSLSNVANVSDERDLNLDGVIAMTTVSVNRNPYLFAAGVEDDGVSVFSIGNDGSLDNVANVSDWGVLNLDYPISMATTLVNGITYLFVSGVNDDGVSMFSVGANGSLNNITNISDEGDLELESPFSIITADINNNPYFFVAGYRDHGVSMFSIAADGSVWNVDNVSDDENLLLLGATSMATANIDGSTYLFVAGYDDNGMSVFWIH